MGSIIYHERDADMSVLDNQVISVIGYGNQAKAQALNMRDSGLNVVIGNLNEKYKERAENDNFDTYSIEEAVEIGDIIFLLIPDEDMSSIFNEIKSNIRAKKVIVFSSGYYIGFKKLVIPSDVDILLISPRLLGEGVRERFLTGKGYFTFVHVHNNCSGNAEKILLALTKSIGGLINAAIDLPFKQQAILSMFAKQAFYPAFDQVLIRSITNLVDSGYPPEAVFVELILSEEGSYTVDKMIDVGLLKQMNFHSQTSQYGSLSRAMKFRVLGKDIEAIQNLILKKIESGSFSEEWESELRDLKLKALKYLSFNTNFSNIEKDVRENLGFPFEDSTGTFSIQDVKDNSILEDFFKKNEEFYSQF